LIDTVGFIRKLPHHLVASFKSTLEETQEADLLLHVIDISSPNFREQIHTVNQVMKELNIDQKPVLHVFNKVDRVNDRDLISLVKSEFTPAVTVSARRKIFLDQLEHEIEKYATENFIELDLKLNIQRQKEIAQLHSMTNILDKKYDNGFVNLKVRVNKSRLSQIESLIN
ncbi:GTPase HflX, partial [candidate division KSB1 bacterium]|nr:GTPase HflX [candidate division KSB1 bacterium]